MMRQEGMDVIMRQTKIYPQKQLDYIEKIKMALNKAINEEDISLRHLHRVLEDKYDMSLNRTTLKNTINFMKSKDGKPNTSMDFFCLAALCDYFQIDIGAFRPPRIGEEDNEENIFVGRKENLHTYLVQHKEYTIDKKQAARQYDGYRRIPVGSEYSGNDRFNPTPSGVWRIRLFLYLLKDAQGNIFLPLELAEYGGIWSVPNICHPLMGSCRNEQVETIRKRIVAEVRKSDRLFEELEIQQLYQMGLFDCQTEHILDDYIEYKASLTNEGQHKCYYIEIYNLPELDSRYLINLFDPEHYRGYRFLPIDQNGVKDSKFVWKQEGTGGVWFLGQPVSTNIVNLIHDMKSIDYRTYCLPPDMAINEFGCYRIEKNDKG